jgi:hypothetical protein
MPRKPIDYSTRIVYFYKFVRIDEPNFTDCYVGHTVDIIKRKCNHKTVCHNPNSKTYNLKIYKTIRDNGGWDNWKMLVIHQQICKNDIEARQIEQNFIEELGAKMNILNAYISEEDKKEYHKEFYENNKEQLIEYYKEYRENNKEKIKEYRKELYENNKEKFNQKNKEYRENNKEYHKEYYENNKEQHKKLLKNWYNKNKNKLSEKHYCECGGKYTFQHKLKHERTSKHKKYCLSLNELE